MTIASRLLASLLLLGAGEAAAQKSGYYVQGALGAAFSNDVTFDAGPLDTKLKTDTGFAGSLAGGYIFSSGLRAELEFAHRRIGGESFAGFSATDSLSVNAVMANAAYELNTGTWLRPYAGVGLGYAWAGSQIRASDFRIRGDDGGIAYQGILGLAVDLGGPLTGVVDYRYFRMPDVRYTVDPGLSVKDDISAHTLMVGLRWNF